MARGRIPDSLSEKSVIDYIRDKYPDQTDIEFWENNDFFEHQIGYSYTKISMKSNTVYVNRIQVITIKEWIILNRDKKINFIIN